MSLQKTVFGRQKIKPNTFIGGVSATINTAALAATKLGISASRIKAFSVIGSNVQFAVIGGTYSLPASTFTNNDNITYFEDNDGLVTAIPGGAFYSCDLLHHCVFPNCTNIGGGTYAAGGAFSGCINLEYVTAPNAILTGGYNFNGCAKLLTANHPLVTSIPQLCYSGCVLLSAPTFGIVTSLGTQAFSNCYELLVFDYSQCGNIPPNAFNNCYKLNSLNTTIVASSIGIAAFKNNYLLSGLIADNCGSMGYQAFEGCSSAVNYSFAICTTLQDGGIFTKQFAGNSSVQSIYMPVCNYLGDVTNGNVFQNIKIGATITVANSLSTVNAGAPDGDLVYASGTRGATIVYI